MDFEIASALTLLVRWRARFEDTARDAGDPIRAATNTFEIDFAALCRQIRRTRFLGFHSKSKELWRSFQ